MTNTSEKPRIDHRRALADYLAQRHSRSLRGLRRAYDSHTTIRPPSFHTLAAWSRKYAWQAEAARYDERIAEQVAGKMERAEVKERFNQVAEFNQIIEQGAQAMKDWISDPANLKKIANAQEFGVVSNALVRLSQLVELLTGNATSRADGTMDIECPDWLAERLGEPATEQGQDPEPEPDPATTRH